MLPPFKMRLYFFPVCPASRAVWLFLVEHDIPFELIKIDFQNGEHLSAKFTEINPHHTVPVVQDQTIILTQCNTILRYLGTKYHLNQWYPAEIADRAKIDLYLDWHQGHFKRVNQIALENAVGYSTTNFSLSAEGPSQHDMEKVAAVMRSYQETLALLESIFLDKTDFIAGNLITIADLVAATEITFHRLLNTELSPKVSQWLERVISTLQPTTWKTVHADWEKWITSSQENIRKAQEQAQRVAKKGRDAKGGSKPPDVCHSVSFLDPPRDVFTHLTDPAFLTKATGSACTFSPKCPGTFSYYGEQVSGTNLVFVQDLMILQSWRATDWPQGRFCTTKIVLERAPEVLGVPGGTEVILTQSDVPEGWIRRTDEWWQGPIGFWRAVEGTVTRNILQNVFFEYAPPHDLYELMMDSGRLSRLTRTRCEVGRGVGSELDLCDGQITGKTTDLVTDSRIVQRIRFADWPPNHMANASCDIKRVAGGTDLIFNLTGVPADKWRQVSEFWEKTFWRKMQKEFQQLTVR
eukprot:TRINITY_DN17279_c0_g1_i1.p1 TRINITY_DN17279_c0_g1~~TRINITY_DN17279_c0_g1_i1.p1  ORF type:complete len:522 (-),score=83.90 TRINITY_DN17279_c0_g1_i1:63-1628(-)